MSKKTAYIVTDLGPGDGGKGGVVHRIATLFKAIAIIKKGGAQGSHGVMTASGQKFAFSQWGCGTLEGIPTHMGTGIVASPDALLNEATGLRISCDVHDPFGLLTVEEGILCATRYHLLSSRLKELARGKNPRGTIGTGVGETYRYDQWHPELSLHMRNLGRADLRDRVAAIQAQIQQDLDAIIDGHFLPDDVELAQNLIDRLFDPDYFEHVVERLQLAYQLTNVVPDDYLAERVFSRDGLVVVETSHGILTDRYQGFDPHTSAIRTLPGLTRQMLRDAGYEGVIKNLGIHRGYEIRHGAGPMPTTDPSMSENLLPGSHKQDNRWQGNIRVGPLDLMLMRYAIKASGGASEYDGLAITWFDQIAANHEWRVCNGYTHDPRDAHLFTESGDLMVCHGEDEEQLAHTRALGEALLRCTPEITTHSIAPNATPDDLFTLVSGQLNEQLGIPVRMLSLGPTEGDKLLR